MPISIAARGKSTICPRSLIDDNTASAGDHDFHCVNFTPSVNLIVHVKDSLTLSDCDEVLQSYYKGTCACIFIQLLIFYVFVNLMLSISQALHMSP